MTTSGHLPHIEQPERVLELTRELAGEPAGRLSRSVDAVNGE
jgi:hypothetical protein